MMIRSYLMSPTERVMSGGATPQVAADRPAFLKDLRTDRSSWEKERPAIERDGLLAGVFTTLSLREKASVILEGEPGVGKTALLYEVVRRIVGGKVPALQNRGLFLLDIPALVQSTPENPVVTGTLENRLKTLDTFTSGLVTGAIIFVDEIGRLFQLPGLGGAMKLTVHLKETLARGLVLFGTTTEAECRSILTGDPALERRLNPLEVPPMDVASSTAVLRASNTARETDLCALAGGRRVRVPESALKEVAKLADRHLKSRKLPDSALSVLDLACTMRVSQPMSLGLEIEEVVSKIHLQFGVALRAIRDEEEGELNDAKKELVQLATRYYQRLEQLKALEGEKEIKIVRDDLLAAIAYLTKIPVAKLGEDEREKLLGLEGLLSERVVGQPEAKKSLGDAIRRARTLPKPGSPYGVFFFVGPTGVGKTEIAKALAEKLFGSETAMVRFDMSEFAAEQTHSRLLGAPPGYVGHDQGGELTNAVRKSPYCVVLLDEFEKAHPVIWQTLLSAFGEARLTDAKGRTADLSNVLFIMTSNLAAQEIQQAISGIEDLEDRRRLRRDITERALEATFTPEFRGRLTNVVHFEPLDRTTLPPILDLKIARVARQILERGCQLEVTSDLRDHILMEGYRPELGARPMEGALERLLVNPLSMALLSGTFPPRTVIRADFDGTVTLTPAGEVSREVFLIPEVDGRVGASVYRLLSLIDVKASERIVEISREEMAEILSPREERVQTALSDAVARGLMPTGRVVLTNDDFRRKDILLDSLASNLAGLGTVGDFDVGTSEAAAEFIRVIGAVAKEAKAADESSNKPVEINYDFSGDTLKVFVRTSRLTPEGPLERRLKDNLMVPLPTTNEETRAVYRSLQRAGDMRLLKLKYLVVHSRGKVGFDVDDKGTTFFLSFKFKKERPTASEAAPVSADDDIVFDIPDAALAADMPLNKPVDETPIPSAAPSTRPPLPAVDDLPRKDAGTLKPEATVATTAPVRVQNFEPLQPAAPPKAPAGPVGYLGEEITMAQVVGKSPLPVADTFLILSDQTDGRWSFFKKKQVSIPRALIVLSFAVVSGRIRLLYNVNDINRALEAISKAAEAAQEADVSELKRYLNTLVGSLKSIETIIQAREMATVPQVFRSIWSATRLAYKKDEAGFRTYQTALATFINRQLSASPALIRSAHSVMEELQKIVRETS